MVVLFCYDTGVTSLSVRPSEPTSPPTFRSVIHKFYVERGDCYRHLDRTHVLSQTRDKRGSDRLSSSTSTSHVLLPEPATRESQCKSNIDGSGHFGRPGWIQVRHGDIQEVNRGRRLGFQTSPTPLRTRTSILESQDTDLYHGPQREKMGNTILKSQKRVL